MRRFPFQPKFHISSQDENGTLFMDELNTYPTDTALLTGDLMLGSQVSGAAARVGARLHSFSSLDRLCEALATEPAATVLIDLALPSLDIKTLIARLQDLPGGSPRTLAFGSHVHVDRLAAARAAGCDQVMSRGQFHAQMDQLLKPQ